MKKITEVLLVVCILILAFFLRVHNYAEFPIVGETADEYAWTMLGSSLIQTGVPASWSNYGLYEKYRVGALDIGIATYPVVQPVFDHPPLFSFLPGLAQTIRGEDWTQAASAKVMRFPMLFLGVLNAALVYLVARKIWKEPYLRFTALIIYATAPLIVFSSRLVIAENLLVTWTLCSIWLLLSFKPTRRYVSLLIAVAALAALTKASGIVIALVIVAYGITFKEAKIWKAGLVGLLLGVGAYLAYGAYFNWELFLEAFTAQSNRIVGLLTLQNRLFIHPALVYKYYTDGWMLMGLTAVVILLAAGQTKDRATQVLGYFFLATLVFIAFFADEQRFYGWYDYPLYPLFALAIAAVVKTVFTEKKYILLAGAWLLLLPLFRYALLYNNIYYLFSIWAIRGFAILGFVPLIVQVFFPIKNFAKYCAVGVCALILLANVAAIVTFDKLNYWGTDEYLYFRGYIYPDSGNYKK